jgi:hypothetical protein
MNSSRLRVGLTAGLAALLIGCATNPDPVDPDLAPYPELADLIAESEAAWPWICTRTVSKVPLGMSAASLARCV